MTDQFINPYTFVPLPGKAPQRGAPHGHRGDPQLLSGKLSLSITAQTPLLIRGFGERDGEGHPANTLPRRPDGTAFIPASSYKGATRSLHETLTGSCLRVFDPDFLPSYRDSARIRSERVLAVVTDPGSAEKPPTIKLCEKGDARKYRAHQDVLSRHTTRLRSGQRLTVTWDTHDEVQQIDPVIDGDWVLFISDAGARIPQKEPYQAHIRKITETEVAVPEEVWATFLRVVEDTDDRRTKQRAQNAGNTTAPVTYTYKPDEEHSEEVLVGHRHLAGPDLQPGQPVWVDVAASNTVTWLGLAMNWRHLGATAAGDRVGAFNPCDDPEDLCPSCRLFGSIDPNEREQLEAADQLAYRGHVRFSDAEAIDDPAEVWATLPPMGAPRPGAGQAYLDNSKIPQGAKDDPALREWGSPAADGKNPRPVRGRKHYWQAAPNGREQVREHHRDHPELISHAQVFPEGTTFQATITFTDIDEAQLGSLIAALHPSGILNDDALHVHIGGGKPLGFGQCRIALDPAASELHQNGARYGLDQPERDLAEEAPALLDTFRSSVGTAVKETWPLLRRTLHPNAVPSGIVWYPPGARWKTRETGQKEDLDKFDEGFEFWKRSAGFASSQDADGGYPLTSLPRLRDKPADDDGYDQAMDIVEKGS